MSGEDEEPRCLEGRDKSSHSPRRHACPGADAILGHYACYFVDLLRFSSPLRLAICCAFLSPRQGVRPEQLPLCHSQADQDLGGEHAARRRARRGRDLSIRTAICCMIRGETRHDGSPFLQLPLPSGPSTSTGSWDAAGDPPTALTGPDIVQLLAMSDDLSRALHA